MTTAATDRRVSDEVTGPRRILDLRDSPWVDGPGRTILDTASTIDPQRYRIVIGAFSGASHGEHRYLAEAMNRGLETCPIAEQRSLDFGVLDQILRSCCSHAIDAIHTHDFRSDLYGLIAARRLGIPAVATCHGWIANDLKGWLRVSVDKLLLRFFDRVVVVSERMREQLDKHGLPSGRVVVVQNALIVENYRAARGERAVRQEWSIPAHHRVVGNIGRLSAEKCQDLFLRAGAEVVRRMPDISFVLVGVGPDEARLRRLASELGIADRVVFAGYRNDMQAVYNSLDLVVQSSRTEGMPNVILEALLMRVPVVATDVGGTAEIVTDGLSGRLVPPNDLGALARALHETLSDPTRAARCAETAERHVRVNFSHAARLRRLADVYDEALGCKPPRASAGACAARPAA